MNKSNPIRNLSKYLENKKKSNSFRSKIENNNGFI